MKWVEPKVFKIAETKLNRNALTEFLTAIGAREWMEDQPWFKGEAVDEGAALMEIAGRACYKSFGVGLNPNISRIRGSTKEYLRNVLTKGDGSVIEQSATSWIFSDVSRVFCYSEDTEVLTDEGWKDWPSVRGDELFASLTTGNELVFEPAEERFVAFYTGPMYQVQSQQLDLLVTPNHRMWVQPIDTRAYRRDEEPFSFYEAQAILHKRMRYQKGGVRWRGVESELFVVSGTRRTFARRDRNRLTTRPYVGVSMPLEPFARFLGFYVSEGSLGKPDTSINLYQNEGPVLDEMVSTVRAMGFRPMVTSPNGRSARKLTFKHVALYDWLKTNCGDHSLRKRLPRIADGWSPRIAWHLLDALIKGDGSVHKANGHRVLYTSSKALADDVQILALKLGIAANIRVDRRVESHRIHTGVVISKSRPNYIVSFVKHLFPHVNIHLASPWPNRFRAREGFDDRMVQYSGRVYCVKVKHGLLYVRRNGKPCWSGNTHELVRHRVGTAISQESLRYVRPTELRMTLVPGSELTRIEDLEEVTRLLEKVEKGYLDLANQSIRPEMDFDAKKGWTSALRRVLPDGIATNVVWTANHRALRWVLEMRTDPGAEAEMRYVFDKVGQIVARDHPEIYGDFERLPHKDGVGAQWVPRLRSKV